MKTGGARRLWVRVPRLPLDSGELNVDFPIFILNFQIIKSCGPAAKAAALQADDRRFESVQDYSFKFLAVNVVRKAIINFSGCRKVWSFRRFWEPKIAGSNPAILTGSG